MERQHSRVVATLDSLLRVSPFIHPGFFLHFRPRKPPACFTQIAGFLLRNASTTIELHNPSCLPNPSITTRDCFPVDARDRSR